MNLRKDQFVTKCHVAVVCVPILLLVYDMICVALSHFAALCHRSNCYIELYRIATDTKCDKKLMEGSEKMDWLVENLCAGCLALRNDEGRSDLRYAL